MLELLFEVVFQLFGEAILDAIIHLIGESRRARTAFLIVIFAAAGAAFGAVSLFIFPEHMVRDATLRLALLILSPLIAGALFAFIGKRRRRNEKRTTSLETFWPALTFALAFSVVRHYGAS